MTKTTGLLHEDGYIQPGCAKVGALLSESHIHYTCVLMSHSLSA